MKLNEQIRWPGHNTEAQPSDTVPLHLILLDTSTHQTAIIVLVICIVFSLVFHRMLWTNRKHEVIKASSPLFCHVILLGSLLVYVGTSITLFYGSPSQDTFELGCRTIPTFLSLGFTVVFSALMAKTWRIHKIFNSHHLRSEDAKGRQLNWKQLMKIVGVAVMLDAFVLTAWMVGVVAIFVARRLCCLVADGDVGWGRAWGG